MSARKKKKKDRLCIKETNSISSHLNNAAAKIAEALMEVFAHLFKGPLKIPNLVFLKASLRPLE